MGIDRSSWTGYGLRITDLAERKTTEDIEWELTDLVKPFGCRVVYAGCPMITQRADLQWFIVLDATHAECEEAKWRRLDPDVSSGFPSWTSQLHDAARLLGVEVDPEGAAWFVGSTVS